MKSKFLLLMVCLFILVTGLIGCGKPKSVTSANSESKKIKVIASIYPLYDFTRQIGGDKVEVVCLVPAGAEPHDWEPKARDLASLQSANLFIYNGLGMEPWLDSFQSALKGSKCFFVNASQGISLLKAKHDDEPNQGEKDRRYSIKSAEASSGEYDPHVWLDPMRAKQQAANIKAALIQVSPENKETFEANYARFAAALDDLDAQFRAVASQATRKEFVVTEPAFAYLADRYGLKQVSILGLCTEGEPSPGELKKIVDFARQNKIKHIFFESTYSPKVAETLAKEVGAQTLVLSAVHGLTEEDLKQGKNYLSTMKSNLENLKIALQDKE